MQNAMNREPLRVTQEAVEAYEKRSGFYGIGKKMVETGAGRSSQKRKYHAHGNQWQLTNKTYPVTP